MQVQHYLLSFEVVTLEYQMCFCSYIPQQDLLRLFFPFQLRQVRKHFFPLLTYAYFVLLYLPAEEAPDGEQDNDKLTKSPPPPPPRRSYLPGSGLTTTRSGEVIFTARKEAAAVKVR